MCDGGHLRVDFRPGELLSVQGFGDASSEEIAVECGEPERVAMSDEELRRRSATPTGADLAAPTFEPTRLSCVADGPLLVEAHPVWVRTVSSAADSALSATVAQSSRALSASSSRRSCSGGESCAVRRSDPLITRRGAAFHASLNSRDQHSGQKTATSSGSTSSIGGRG